MFLAQTECPGVTHERLHFHFLKVLTLENHNIDEDNDEEEGDLVEQALYQLDSWVSAKFSVCRQSWYDAGFIAIIKIRTHACKGDNSE